MDALNKLHLTVTKAFKVNPVIKFEVFIHKVDGLTEDNKMETQRDIHQRANDDLTDSGIHKVFSSFSFISKFISISFKFVREKNKEERQKPRVKKTILKIVSVLFQH